MAFFILSGNFKNQKAISKKIETAFLVCYEMN